MKVIIKQLPNGFTVTLIDPNTIIDGEPLIIKRGTAFDRVAALSCAQLFIDTNLSIAEENDEEIHDIPVYWITPLSVLQQLLFCLEESHTDEVINDHFGDDFCSYCSTIAIAKSLLKAHNLQPLNSL